MEDPKYIRCYFLSEQKSVRFNYDLLKQAGLNPIIGSISIIEDDFYDFMEYLCIFNNVTADKHFEHERVIKLINKYQPDILKLKYFILTADGKKIYIPSTESLYLFLDKPMALCSYFELSFPGRLTHFQFGTKLLNTEYDSYLYEILKNISIISNIPIQQKDQQCICIWDITTIYSHLDLFGRYNIFGDTAKLLIPNTYISMMPIDILRMISPLFK